MRRKKTDTGSANILCEIVCPVCGKVFIPAPLHIYRDKRATSRRVCSWACVCKSERLKEEDRERKAMKRKRKKAGDRA